MRILCAPCLALLLAATPATAQEGAGNEDRGNETPGNEDIEQGFDLLREGSRLMLRGLLDRLEPTLRDLEGALDDLNAYYPPEILPNGDILIRRREPPSPPDDEAAPEDTPESGPETAPETAPDDAVDL